MGERSARGGELVEEFGKILAGELPFERPSSVLPVVLKVEKALGKAVEIGKIVGRQDLPLDDGEVDFDLVEPTGVHRSVHEDQTGVEVP